MAQRQKLDQHDKTIEPLVRLQQETNSLLREIDDKLRKIMINTNDR